MCGTANASPTLFVLLAGPMSKPPATMPKQRGNPCSSLSSSSLVTPTANWRPPLEIGSSPLGDWLAPLDAHWICWHDPATDTIWENRQPNEWHTWTALPRRYQHSRFSHVGPSVDAPPGNRSRAMVRVSGSVARMQDIGVSLPREPPLAPSTLQEAILALPPTCLWAVQHAKSDDQGLKVAHAIAQGTAVAVSDGSLRYTLGTSAFVIEGSTPDHHVIGYNRVPGPVEEGDSH